MQKVLRQHGKGLSPKSSSTRRVYEGHKLSLLEDFTQGHPWSKNMLDSFKERYYCPEIAAEIQAFKNNYQTCIRSKQIAKQHLRPRLQKIYDPSNGPEHLMKINPAGQFPPSNGFTHNHTAEDVFSRYIFAILLRRSDALSTVKGLVSISTRPEYVSAAILTDKGTVFTAKLLKQTLEQSGINVKNKHAQTNGMIEKTLRKLKTVLKVNINADQPQRNQYVNIAVMAQNTAYHDSLKCALTEIITVGYHTVH